jgi:hypothetical protein
MPTEDTPAPTPEAPKPAETKTISVDLLKSAVSMLTGLRDSIPVKAKRLELDALVAKLSAV